jgi:hypothetical protein
VAQASRLNKFESPIHDNSGRLEPVLALQLKGYADEDPGTNQQQALPLEVLDRARQMNDSDREEAVGQLIVVAFFFAMRSCKYLGVQGQRMTTVVGIDDVRFWLNGEQLRTDDHDQLRGADSVSVTFRRQKNRDNGVVVTPHRNDNPGDDVMCPVRALADLVFRVRGYVTEGRARTTSIGINSFVSDKTGARLEEISSKEVLRQLRTAATAVGEGRLGFSAERIGTHSIRAGAAMAMCKAGVPCETIQLVGRWRRRTFMKYLRIQVPATTRGVTTKMTSLKSFFTVTVSDDSDDNNETNHNKIGRNQVDTRKRT